MGTSRLNVMIRDHACVPIRTGWMLDLVVQLCGGTPLFEVFPLVDQLKKRYAKPAKVFESSDFPLADQSGRTVEITVGMASPQVLTFVSPAVKQIDIYNQMKAFFTDVDIEIVDDRITVTTKDFGPTATLAIAGDCDLDWGPVEQGSGYDIGTRYYHNAWRINIRPPSGENINHVEMDVPTGCFKLWSRVCFGGNEETSVVMKIVEKCGECYTADLLLPEVMNCSQGIIYPLMDKVVVENPQILPELADRVVAMRAVAYAANLNRAQILEELADRKQDAFDIDRTDLAERVDQLITVAEALPQC